MTPRSARMPLWRRLLSRRALVPFVGSTLYALAAAYQGPSAGGVPSSGFGFSGFLIACTALALSVRAAFRDHVPVGLAEWGLALILASLAGEPGASWGEVAGSIGAAVVCYAAARAMTADAAAIVAGVGFAWGMAAYAHVASALGSESFAGTYARPLATFFGVCGSGVLFLACMRSGAARELELGLPERFRACTAALAAGVAFSLVASLAHLTPSDRAVRAGAGVSAALIVVVSLHVDAVAIARIARLGAVLGFLLGPLIVIASLMADEQPHNAGWVVFCSGILAALGGLWAPRLASTLRPARGAWLDAMEKAEEVLLRDEPVDAMAGVLQALREPAGPQAPSPELWTFAPMRVLRIDSAGYARAREEELLPELIGVASQEREAVLRTSVLEALEVRRPDLRPVLRWMVARDALSAVVVVRAGEPEGLLVLPRGGRVDPMSLEEVLALRRLAERLGAACHMESSTARARQRERDLARMAEESEERAARLEHEAEVDAARHVRATARLARPATVGIYSANARLAYDALERRAKVGAPQVVVARSGVDPVPYLARAHLAGARKSKPLVLVDGTGAREHDLARWTDPVTSPLSLADGGVLVLLDGASLPADVQRLIARALTEKRAPWERAEPLDIAVVLTTVPHPAELLDTGRLDPALASRFGDALEHPVVLPRIRERPEDTRAIITDRLAREGMRVLGSPVGLEDAAFARLVEYPFLGEDAEVATIVRALVARCAEDGGRLVVRSADIDALGLDFPEEVLLSRGLGRGIRLV